MSKKKWFKCRCMVEPGAGPAVNKCSFKSCMANRQLAVKNQVPFQCKHLDEVESSIQTDTVGQ